jgi:hypothetical protein
MKYFATLSSFVSTIPGGVFINNNTQQQCNNNNFSFGMGNKFFNQIKHCPSKQTAKNPFFNYLSAGKIAGSGHAEVLQILNTTNTITRGAFNIEELWISIVTAEAQITSIPRD